ncbi:hypothetical protein LTR50_005126 [Elasticomyces elasticus]|nr:hypothetical protein LTR50_005126 [Elasticomyces elasticus]
MESLYGDDPTFYRHEAAIEAGSGIAEALDRSNVSVGMALFEPLGVGEFRVLNLHAGEPTDAVHCTLHVCAIHYSGPFPPSQDSRYALSVKDARILRYSALSYAWGSTVCGKNILCNGHVVKITNNLYNALRYFRRSDRTLSLWIDQLCIDQSDNDEKSGQVSMMGRIYGFSWNTIVWLGEAQDNSDKALETIENIFYSMRYVTNGRHPPLEDFERLSIPTPGSALWQDLNLLLGRPWFRRVWVIQEVALSDNVYVRCGHRSLSWHVLSIFALIMKEHSVLESPQLRTERPDWLPKGVRNRQDERSSLQPNYSDTVSVCDVYMAATIEVLCEEDARIHRARLFPPGTVPYDVVVKLLCCVDHFDPQPNCPSWVPNWGKARETVSLGYDSASSRLYKAGTGPGGMPDAGHYMRIQQELRTLVMTGRIFDIIGEIGASFVGDAENLLHKAFFDEDSSIMINSHHMAMRCDPYPGESGLFEAFWQTFVAAKDFSGLLRAPPTCGDVFGVLLDEVIGMSPAMPDQSYPSRTLTMDHLRAQRARRPAQIYRELEEAIYAACSGRTYFTTMKRYMGLGPKYARQGDRICVFTGSHVPFIVRPHQDQSYQLVGECYVHGIMQGEVLRMNNILEEPITLR